jgi:TRAP-type C4-dicarboxylate transport system permease large subunit
MPVITQLGIDPAISAVMVLNLMIGLLHRPWAWSTCWLSRQSVDQKTTMAILPWLVPLLLSLILITYVPSISLWLPHLFY